MPDKISADDIVKYFFFRQKIDFVYHSADYIFISLGIIGPIGIFFENRVLLMYTLEGVSTVLQTSLLLMKGLKKPRLPFLMLIRSLFPKTTF